MRATTRFWTVAVLAGFLAFWAVLLERLLPLVGATALVAWLLAGQYRFVSVTAGTIEQVTVDQETSRRQVSAGDETLVTVSVDADAPLPFDCRVTLDPPAGADAAERSFTVERNERTRSHAVTVTWPVAGSFTLGRPTVTFRDRLGLFERSVSTGPTATVTVEPRAPRNVHFGQGGDPIAVGLGEHEAGRTGSGLEPAQVREYVSGDAVRHIDWKATARLGHPHVREFESETDRETVLFVDHRASMGTGPSGETKLDFLRQVALAFVDSARELADPLGCRTVGDDGVTASFDPDANADHQRAIRRQVQAVEPTDPIRPATTDDRDPMAPDRAGLVRQRLATDETAYGRRLAPFFDRPDAYVERIVDRPLVVAVRSTTTRLDGTIWSVLVTDDSRETEVREAVQLARRGRGWVLVFLAPTVLYEPGGLGDLDAAYERYTAFEEFRQSLAAMDRVTAFEVGPADRLSAVLATGHDRWQESRQP